MLFTMLGLTTASLLPTAIVTNSLRRNDKVGIQKTLAVHNVQVSQDKLKKNQIKQAVKKIGPVLSAAFCAAAIMYPLDLLRALQMANANSGPLPPSPSPCPF